MVEIFSFLRVVVLKNHLTTLILNDSRHGAVGIVIDFPAVLQVVDVGHFEAFVARFLVTGLLARAHRILRLRRSG